MKRTPILRVGLVALGLLSPLAASALDPATNGLTLSLRFGLNISAKFSGASALAIPPNPRITPNQEVYNYDNGYLFPDISGSDDGLTWYVGYDNSSRQVDAGANTILLSRASGPATLRSHGMGDDPTLGAELTYTRELGGNAHWRYGFEVAVNDLNLSLHSSSSYSLRGPRLTDAFPYEPGTTPPAAAPDNPYQGTFAGPNFVVGTTPVSSITAVDTVGTVTGWRSLEVDLWGGRLGPYLEIPIADPLRVTLSGGLAVGLLDNSVAWNETITFASGASLSDAGHGSNWDCLWGGYLAANAYWHVSDRWTAAVGVQYQNLGIYKHTYGTRRMELDLSNSFFLTLGLSYNF